MLPFLMDLFYKVDSILRDCGKKVNLVAQIYAKFALANRTKMARETCENCRKSDAASDSGCNFSAKRI